MRRLSNLFYACRDDDPFERHGPYIPVNAQGNDGGRNAPKNLKVLTPENLMALMQTFPVALGVQSQGGCNFCHDKRALAR